MKQHDAVQGVEDAVDVAMLDPDVRFLLANERTLLAWVRTGLALVGGGLVLGQIGTGLLQQGVGITAILLGAGMTVLGYSRYKAADRAIRAARLPETGRGTAVQVVLVIGFALAVAGIELSRAL
jgi:putative membrane protein